MKTNVIDEKERNLSFAQGVINRVRKLLDKYMLGFGQYEDLKEFMSSDNNLYNPDGSLTDEYRQKIKEVEGYVSNKPIDSVLIESVGEDELDSEVLKGIIEFVERRSDVIKLFTEKEKQEGDNFDAEKFVTDLVRNDFNTPEDRKAMFELLDELAERDTLESLDEEVVKEAFKEILNSKRK